MLEFFTEQLALRKGPEPGLRKKIAAVVKRAAADENLNRANDGTTTK
jgi:hypothetical protein